MISFKDTLAIALLVLGMAGRSHASACTTINSIQYCEAVDSVTYTDIAYAGSYQDVIGMDADACTCQQAPKAYSGSLSPLDEQLSLHFRGPLDLKRFAVYYPDGSAQAKRSEKRSEHFGRHKRHHHMKRDHHMGVAGAKKEDCKFVNGALAKIAPVSGTTGEIVGAAAAKSVSDTESAGSKELEVAPAQQEVQQKAVEIGESSSSSSESHSSESSSSGSSSSGSSSSSSSSGSGGSGSSGSESHQSESHESGSNDSGSSSSSSSSGSNGSGSSGSESHQSGSHSSGSNQSGSSSYTSTSSAPSPTKAISSGKGFSRIAFYDAKAGVSQGLVFLNHKGGQGSGTFDSCWGNSISYAGKTCSSGSSKPEILADIVLPSNEEFMIFSDEKCNGDCGYYRPNTPAYRGFDGKDKVFVFEFKMPDDSGTGFNKNMPSIWALNAKIPRTAQYNSCSCWGTGCGELDMFEVLEGATDYVKTHYHASQGGNNGAGGGGGSPTYFKRPFDKFIKAAAIFNEAGAVTIKYLSDDFDFGSSTSYEGLAGAVTNPSVYKVPS